MVNHGNHSTEEVAAGVQDASIMVPVLRQGTETTRQKLDACILARSDVHQSCLPAPVTLSAAESVTSRVSCLLLDNELLVPPPPPFSQACHLLSSHSIPCSDQGGAAHGLLCGGHRRVQAP